LLNGASTTGKCRRAAVDCCGIANVGRERAWLPVLWLSVDVVK
jgi:hypothetical protein